MSCEVLTFRGIYCIINTKKCESGPDKDKRRTDMGSFTAVQPQLLTCNGLCKSYGYASVLNGIDLTVSRGRIVGLLGPNGCGKTTLLKLIAGLLTPSLGEVLVDGQEIGVETKKLVSYLPERTYFDDSMTVGQAVRLFDDFYTDFDRDKADLLIDRLGVPYGARLRTLSKGTKERLQLVLVMSRRAELYLLDEPIGGVDPAARDLILDLILSERNSGSTVVISTHLIGDIERVLDDAVMLFGGRVFLADSCENIRNRTGGTVDRLFREVFRC